MRREELVRLPAVDLLAPVDEAVLLQVFETLLALREVLEAFGRRVVLPELHAAETEEEGQDVGCGLPSPLLPSQVEHEDLPELRLPVLEQELEALRRDGQPVVVGIPPRVIEPEGG